MPSCGFPSRNCLNLPFVPPLTPPLSATLSHILRASTRALPCSLAVVLLFAVYLLLGGSSPKTGGGSGEGGGSGGESGGESGGSVPSDHIDAQADAQINTYIRGKVAMSLLVGSLTALSLGLLQVDLWMIFGLLAFVPTQRGSIKPAD